MLKTQKNKVFFLNNNLNFGLTLQPEAVLLCGLDRGLVCPLATALCSLDSELLVKIGVHSIIKILTQKNNSLEIGNFLMLSAISG